MSSIIWILWMSSDCSSLLCSVQSFKVDYFVILPARKFRAKKKTECATQMPKECLELLWCSLFNWYACLFNYKHHLFNARRVWMFITSATCRWHIGIKCRFVSCLIPFSLTYTCFFQMFSASSRHLFLSCLMGFVNCRYKVYIVRHPDGH